jgi:hypothetical protein
LERNDLHVLLSQQVKLPTAESHECKNCGAVTELPVIHLVKFCPFCRSPLGLELRPHKHFSPEALLPFTLTRAQALDALVQWNDVRTDFITQAEHLPVLTGSEIRDCVLEPVFLPYWLFFPKADAPESCVVDIGPQESVNAKMPASIPHYNGKDFPRQECYVLEPWPLERLVSFDPTFLRQIAVEAPLLDVNDAWSTFENSVAFYDLHLRKGGSRLDVQKTAEEQARYFEDSRNPFWRRYLQATQVDVMQCLLPVWIGHLRLGNRSYRIFMNGASGEVVWDMGPLGGVRSGAQMIGKLVGVLCFFSLGIVLGAVLGNVWIFLVLSGGAFVCMIRMGFSNRFPQYMGHGASSITGSEDEALAELDAQGRTRRRMVKVPLLFFGAFIFGVILTVLTGRVAFVLIFAVLGMIAAGIVLVQDDV